MGADYPKNPWEQFKKRYLGNENNRGLYWRDPTVNSCPKEKPPGSPRTFSTVPYPRTSSLRAKRRPPLSLSFFHSAYFAALFRALGCGAKAKRQVVRLPYPLDER